jgi:hypothetical protein
VGRRDKFTAGDRLATGVGLVVAAIFFFFIGQARVGFLLTGLFLFPYLALIAPFRCNNPKSGSRRPCMNNGYGFLIGCTYHRLDTIRRILRRDPQQPLPIETVGSGARRATPTSRSPEPSVGTVTTRRKIFDIMGFVVSLLGTVAGWLPFFVGKGA